MSSTHERRQVIGKDVKLGRDVKLARFLNLYRRQIGDETRIGAFVAVQRNAKIGRRCKISSHSFICEGVTIEDDVFIGQGVKFINDAYPRATTPGGELQTEKDCGVETTLVKTGAPAGSGATIICNITPNTIVAGNPARAAGCSSERATRTV
jgi:UDP-2-acetamido-3-amino-2,3-dideoxy-glucuronate N-acetyltransferase